MCAAISRSAAKTKEGADLEPDGTFKPSDGDGKLQPGGGRDTPEDRRTTPTPKERSDSALGTGRPRMAQSENTKVSRLLGLVDEVDDKMVIFTQFRATQELIQRRLKEAAHDVAIFHGGLSRLEKEAADRTVPRAGAAPPVLPRPAARAVTFSSRTPSATSTCPGTR